MKVNKQLPICFINKCGCRIDYTELEKAIFWFSDKPVVRTKSIYMYGRYPAVSIYDKKIHVHRLLLMYWLQRDLEPFESTHHKDGDILNAAKSNLLIMSQEDHVRLHLGGETQDPDFVKRRITASVIKRWPSHDNPELFKE